MGLIQAAAGMRHPWAATVQLPPVSKQLNFGIQSLMAIQWNAADVQEFLGKVEFEGVIEGMSSFHYQGFLLKYCIYIDEAKEMVWISGDDVTPFGADSLFEFATACDLIRIVPDPYYPSQKALEFSYRTKDELDYCRMAILKRPKGDLKVWPEHPLSPNHILRKREVDQA